MSFIFSRVSSFALFCESNIFEVGSCHPGFDFGPARKSCNRFTAGQAVQTMSQLSFLSLSPIRERSRRRKEMKLPFIILGYSMDKVFDGLVSKFRPSSFDAHGRFSSSQLWIWRPADEFLYRTSKSESARTSIFRRIISKKMDQLDWLAGQLVSGFFLVIVRREYHVHWADIRSLNWDCVATQYSISYLVVLASSRAIMKINKGERKRRCENSFLGYFSIADKIRARRPSPNNGKKKNQKTHIDPFARFCPSLGAKKRFNHAHGCLS